LFVRALNFAFYFAISATATYCRLFRQFPNSMNYVTKLKPKQNARWKCNRQQSLLRFRFIL